MYSYHNGILCHDMSYVTAIVASLVAVQLFRFIFRLLMKQLFLAVDHMHKHNVTHRDLKPENILLDKDEILKISNFWFAQVVNDGELLTSKSAFINPF